MGTLTKCHFKWWDWAKANYHMCREIVDHKTVHRCYCGVITECDLPFQHRKPRRILWRRK